MTHHYICFFFTFDQFIICSVKNVLVSPNEGNYRNTVSHEVLTDFTAANEAWTSEDDSAVQSKSG